MADGDLQIPSDQDRSRATERPEHLLPDVLEIQRFVASLPDCDTRPADEIIGYDDAGLS